MSDFGSKIAFSRPRQRPVS